MSDVALFAYGCAVFLIAGAGFFHFAYRRFRAAFFDANREMLGVKPGPVPSRVLSGEDAARAARREDPS